MKRCKQQKWLASGLVAGAMLTGVTATSPAQAAVDPVTVTAWIKVAQEAVKLGKSLLSLAGQDLAEQLRQLEANLIAEMRSQRNQALKSNVRTVNSLFRNLADNATNDPANVELWVAIVDRQQTTADAMYDIISSDADVQSSYELAPAYNVLIATGNNVLLSKKFFNPRFPSSWNDYYIWNQPAMEADYDLVGSQRHQCWAGSNPGYRPQPNPIASPFAYALWLSTTKSGLYKQSQLWRRKLANKSILVERRNMQCHGITNTHNRYCNPGTRTCTSATVPGCFVGPVSWRACAADVTPLDCADSKVVDGFHADPVVKVVRAGMVGIQTLSGGNDFDAPHNNPLMAEGKFVDPWVTEPACGANTPWAYPQRP